MGEDRDKAHRLARELAPLLPGWRAAEPRDDWYWGELVRDADGARISVRAGGYQLGNRVEFHGHAPRFRDGTVNSFDRQWRKRQGDTRTDRISCRADRPVADLAKEIRRRLLPDYDALYVEHARECDAADARDREAEAVATRLAGAIGGEVAGPERRRDGCVHVLQCPQAVSRLRVLPGRVYRSGGGTEVRVDFEVHGLDPETAARVLAVIQEAAQGQAEEAGRLRVEEAPEPAPEEEPEELDEPLAQNLARIA